MKIVDKIINRVRNLDDDQQKEILEILTTMQSGKLRYHPRLDTKVDVDVAVGNRVIQTDSKDISAGGVFINTATSDAYKISEDVRVVFSAPGYDKPFKLSGSIVRVEKGGLAIKFENISPYFKKILDDVIWENDNNIDKDM